MAVIEDQNLVVSWGAVNIKWYKSKGYCYTKIGDKFTVSIQDLFSGSSVRIKYSCDLCGQIFETAFCDLNRTRKKNNRDSGFCLRCSIGTRKLPYDYVKKIFSDGNCELLDSEYLGNDRKLNYKCECGNVSTTTFTSFKNGTRCKNCLPNRKKTTLLSFEYVSNYFKQNDCELLSSKYTGVFDHVDFMCRCGEVSSITFDTFKKTKRCKKCGYASLSKKMKQKLVIEDIRKAFIKEGCKLLTTKEEYLKSNQQLDYVCSCGNFGKSRYHDFLNGSRCKTCKHNKLSKLRKGKPILGLRGENNPNWKGDKLQKERIERRSYLGYKLWRKSVYERDKYVCQCCGDDRGGNLKAHHLDGYEWCIVSRLDINNGVTLCNACHEDFHGLYGTYGNTKEQWYEYMNNLLKENPIFSLI